MSLDKTAFNRVVHFLRRQFTWSDTYKSVKNRSFILFGVNKCEGCYRYICRDEKSLSKLILAYPHLKPEEASLEGFAIDHIIPVGTLDISSLDAATAKIWCTEENLMGLCQTCHYFKTRVDLEDIKLKKLSLIDKIEQGEDL